MGVEVRDITVSHRVGWASAMGAFRESAKRTEHRSSTDSIVVLLGEERMIGPEIEGHIAYTKLTDRNQRR